MRAAIKNRHSVGSSSHDDRRSSGRGQGATMPSMIRTLSAPAAEAGSELPSPLAVERTRSGGSTVPCTPSGGLSQVKVPAKMMHKMRTQCLERETAYLEGVRNEAQEQQPGMYDSVIQFLEMHNLSRGYALGLAANGMDDLSQLLLADEKDLNRAIEASCMDAMDEILFKEAIQTARGSKSSR